MIYQLVAQKVTFLSRWKYRMQSADGT